VSDYILTPWITAYAFGLGACIGSFLVMGAFDVILLPDLFLRWWS